MCRWCDVATRDLLTASSALLYIASVTCNERLRADRVADGGLQLRHKGGSAGSLGGRLPATLHVERLCSAAQPKLISRLASTMNPPPIKTATRRSRSELKQLVLAAGLDVLAASGPQPNTDTLTYKAVFDHLQETQGIRITHASVHERIWASQTAFQIDVLCSAADALPAATFLAEGGAAASVVKTADLSTGHGRMWSTMEMIRVSCNADIASDDFTLSTFQSIRQALARLPNDHPEKDQFVQTVQETRERICSAYMDLFHALVTSLQLRVRPELGIDLNDALAALFAQVVALADGFVLDGPNQNTAMLATGIDGELQHWHMYSWGVWGAARTFLEPDMDTDERDLPRSAPA